MKQGVQTNEVMLILCVKVLCINDYASNLNNSYMAHDNFSQTIWVTQCVHWTAHVQNNLRCRLKQAVPMHSACIAKQVVQVVLWAST